MHGFFRPDSVVDTYLNRFLSSIDPLLTLLAMFNVRGASSARGQRDCKHTPVLALLACEVEGCGAFGEGDGRRESTSLPRKRK
jgi:hypothetical protein